MSIQCTACASEQWVKNGRSRHGHQRYRCKSCGVTFGEVDRRLVPEALKQSALAHYAEGVGLRATERLVGVSHNAVMNWVREEVAGKALARIEASEIEFVEADELWSYVSEKKALSGTGGLLIALPSEFSAGRWVIATPRQPERWLRRFLAATQSLTPPTGTAPTAPSSAKTGTSSARRTPTRLKA
ncbi:MAG: Insertion element protein [Polaromonas sp.]|nr:Insertion element protein [Polaromonas sp.]